MAIDQRFDLLQRLEPFDMESSKVLNLGAGYCASPISSQFSTLRCRHLTNVEIFEPYFRKLVHVPFVSPVENICADVLTWVVDQPSQAFDVTILLDVIEHFTEERAHNLIHHLVRLTRKAIIMFIPFGPCPQGDLDDNHFQTHLSTWTTEDFDEYNARVEVFPDFHTHVDPPADAAWVIIETTPLLNPNLS